MAGGRCAPFTYSPSIHFRNGTMSPRRKMGAVLWTGSTRVRRYVKPAYDANPGRCIAIPGGLGYADLSGSGTTCDAFPFVGATNLAFISKYQNGAYAADIAAPPPDDDDARDRSGPRPCESRAHLSNFAYASDGGTAKGSASSWKAPLLRRRRPASEEEEEEEEPRVENRRRPTTTTGRRGSSYAWAASRRTIIRLLPFTAAPVRVGIVLAVLPGVALGQPAVAARARGNRNISIVSSSPSNVLIPTKNLDGMTHGNDTMTLST